MKTLKTKENDTFYCRPESCDEDVNSDGTVDVTDLLEIVNQWGTDKASADVNNDGIFDVSDLLAVVSGWGDC